MAMAQENFDERYIGISRSTLYVLIARGEIEIVKQGCSTLVLTEILRGLIARLQSTNAVLQGRPLSPHVVQRGN
ncbi:MAG: hypothetical protein C0510_06755 [Erythrobacter sp.]|nr:hypothetical protein [Erythrobacter sp.]